ncbi:hypothetical protein CYMTET_51404 [Cymbomonas tetramitiformis]|uniref:Uncharacterized protein n=1 Tax=Cymbomonas tetramitiformis TaxID=36881 RepID=A0AAE0ERV6_9CHLO|nr:hypothetical protein CYMTET_51404 [Cymbomonas tetramitiformis]
MSFHLSTDNPPADDANAAEGSGIPIEYPIAHEYDTPGNNDFFYDAIDTDKEAAGLAFEQICVSRFSYLTQDFKDNFYVLTFQKFCEAYKIEISDIPERLKTVSRLFRYSNTITDETAEGAVITLHTSPVGIVSIGKIDDRLEKLEKAVKLTIDSPECVTVEKEITNFLTFIYNGENDTPSREQWFSQSHDYYVERYGYLCSALDTIQETQKSIGSYACANFILASIEAYPTTSNDQTEIFARCWLKLMFADDKSEYLIDVVYALLSAHRQITHKFMDELHSVYSTVVKTHRGLRDEFAAACKEMFVEHVKTHENEWHSSLIDELNILDIQLSTTTQENATTNTNATPRDESHGMLLRVREWLDNVASKQDCAPQMALGVARTNAAYAFKNLIERHDNAIKSYNLIAGPAQLQRIRDCDGINLPEGLYFEATQVIDLDRRARILHKMLVDRPSGFATTEYSDPLPAWMSNARSDDEAEVCGYLAVLQGGVQHVYKIPNAQLFTLGVLPK